MPITFTTKKLAWLSAKVSAFMFLLALNFCVTAQTYTNAPISTGATAGNGTAAPAGTTWSEVQKDGASLTLANTSAGANANTTFTIADDFTVPVGQTWNVSRVSIFAYLTGGSPTTSPFTFLRVRIHSGNPKLGPTTIVFGDLTTNVLTASTDPLMYRIFNTQVPATATGTTRKIWRLEANISVALPAGTYWIEFQDNTGFMPTATPPGVRTLPGYNAIQSNAGVWADITDGGVTNTGAAANVPVLQDLPFIIDYTTGCVAATTPTATATPSTVTSGSPSTLAVATGSLGSGTTWQWYTGSCGGTPVGTGATLVVNPTVTTTYFVRATGGCITPGACGSVTVTVAGCVAPPAPTVVPNPLSICQGTAQPLSITTANGFGAPVTVSFPSGTLNTTIPEAVAGINHTVNVSGIPTGAVITAASVTLNINHAYVGDVMISLKAPNTNVLNLDNLLTGTNNPGANFTNTIISSAGVTALSAGTAPWTNTFKADGNTAATGAFGVPSGATGYAPNTPNFAGLYSVPNGPWTIAMYDAGPPDVGSLTNWTLTLTYTPIIPYQGTWSPTTNLFLDAGATVPYTGTPASTVYAKPPASTSYTVTIANGSCVSPVTTVPVTVNTPVAVTSSPANAAVCTDKSVTFTVAATGTGLSYQWQVSTDNGSNYSNIANGTNYAGVTTTTLTVSNPPLSWNGYRYRAVVSGTAPCGPANSTGAIMTVNPLPTITLTAAPYRRLFPGLTTTISVATSPVPAVTYTWYLNGTQISGANTGTYVVNVDKMGTYTVKVTDANGCTNTSGALSILDSASSRLFITPSPNNGQFKVRYYSLPGNPLPRYLYVYDSKGSRIYTQQFIVGAPYQSMDVDITRFRAGVYWVELADANGKRIKFGRTVVL